MDFIIFSFFSLYPLVRLPCTQFVIHTNGAKYAHFHYVTWHLAFWIPIIQTKKNKNHWFGLLQSTCGKRENSTVGQIQRVESDSGQILILLYFLGTKRKKKKWMWASHACQDLLRSIPRIWHLSDGLTLSSQFVYTNWGRVFGAVRHLQMARNVWKAKTRLFLFTDWRTDRGGESPVRPSVKWKKLLFSPQIFLLTDGRSSSRPSKRPFVSQSVK